MALAQRRDEPVFTAEELLRHPDLEPCELIHGRIMPMAPAGFLHGKVESEIASRLLSYSTRSGLGRVAGGEVGIIIRRDPDTVRAADVLFISHQRLSSTPVKGYLEVAPELVVEILSPDDRWSEVMEKLADYFEAGVDRVWVVDPRLRKVFAYRSEAEVVSFADGQTLRDEELLPGFGVAISELFGQAEG